MKRLRFHDADDFESGGNGGERESLPFPRGGVFGLSIPLDEEGNVSDLAQHLFDQMDRMQDMINEVNEELDEADRVLDVIAHLPLSEPRYPAA